VAEQVAGVLGPAVAGKVSGRRGGGEALDTGPDRDRDHILFQSLAVTDAGIATGGEHVDEAVLGDHLQPDFGISGEERRHDRGQDEPRHAERDIESERAGRPLAKAIHHVKRSFDFGQSRSEPLEQVRARLGGNNTPRRPVEEPDAELRLQPAYRLAERGGAAAACPRAIAKAPGARHCHESVQITQIALHCSRFRTTCADCARLSRAPAMPSCAST